MSMRHGLQNSCKYCMHSPTLCIVDSFHLVHMHKKVAILSIGGSLVSNISALSVSQNTVTSRLTYVDSTTTHGTVIVPKLTDIPLITSKHTRSQCYYPCTLHGECHLSSSTDWLYRAAYPAYLYAARKLASCAVNSSNVSENVIHHQTRVTSVPFAWL